MAGAARVLRGWARFMTYQALFLGGMALFEGRLFARTVARRTGFVRRSSTVERIRRNQRGLVARGKKPKYEQDRQNENDDTRVFLHALSSASHAVTHFAGIVFRAPTLLSTGIAADIIQQGKSATIGTSFLREILQGAMHMQFFCYSIARSFHAASFHDLQNHKRIELTAKGTSRSMPRLDLYAPGSRCLMPTSSEL